MALTGSLFSVFTESQSKVTSTIMGKSHFPLFPMAPSSWGPCALVWEDRQNCLVTQTKVPCLRMRSHTEGSLWDPIWLKGTLMDKSPVTMDIMFQTP